MKRFEYRFYREISLLDVADYQYKVMEAAKGCEIQKFALFRGHAYWMRELHDIIRIEFSRSIKLTNEEVGKFEKALNKEFGCDKSTMFVVYEENEK